VNSLQSHRPERGWKLCSRCRVVSEVASGLYNHIAPKGDGNASNSSCVKWSSLPALQSHRPERGWKPFSAFAGNIAEKTTLQSHRPERGWKHRNPHGNTRYRGYFTITSPRKGMETILLCKLSQSMHFTITSPRKGMETLC